jgi:chromosome segregation ATPase
MDTMTEAEIKLFPEMAEARLNLRRDKITWLVNTMEDLLASNDDVSLFNLVSELRYQLRDANKTITSLSRQVSNLEANLGKTAERENLVRKQLHDLQDSVANHDKVCWYATSLEAEQMQTKDLRRQLDRQRTSHRKDITGVIASCNSIRARMADILNTPNSEA